MNKLNTIIITLFISTTFVRALGNLVTCGNGSNCNSCGDTTQITSNFSPFTFTQCLYTACDKPTTYINSLVCQSCYKAPGSITALNVGNFYNPATNACVSSCPLGTLADNTNTCQIIPTKPGNNISCGSSGSCSGCGATTEIQNLFTPVSGSNCKVTDCSSSPSSYNSYVCQSCYQASGSIAALNIGNYYDPVKSACVSSCPTGTTADNTNTCQIIPTKPGNNISCGSSGSCSGCGATTEIQNLFTPVSGSNCKVTDCSSSPSSYNSYVCQSCYQASGAITALNIGNFYNPATNACVASCPKGTMADSTNTCQIIPTKPGNNVSCGSSGSCSGCGAVPQIQNLFTPVSGSNCKVTDCSQSPSQYNGYVCQSCYQASGSIAALNIGNYYDSIKSSCVSSCPTGTTADNTNTCQPNPTQPNNNVQCSSSAFEEEMKKLNTIIITLFIIITFVRAQGGNKVTCSNGSNCKSCGNTNQITQHFMQVSFTQCTYMACQQSTSYINSFVCQSCYQAPNSISALNVGNFYNPATNACVSSCPLGTTADNTNTCQANTKPGNNISCGSSGSCSGCGATNQIQSLFTPVSGQNCKVIDCSQSYGSYNSYVCQSCYQASGTIAALNIGNFYNPATNACVASCPKGTLADNTNTCQIIPTKPGNNVSCGSSGSCSGCGATTQIQNLFTPVSGLNSSGSIAALNIGNYYDPVKSSCVSSCPLGTMADSTNTCQIIPTKPGNNVSCGNSGSCLGCGAAPQIQNLFIPVTGSNCKVTDCSQSPSQYNGYVCQSCYQASGSIAALNIGNYYDSIKTACVSSCPTGTTADNTNTCQPNPTLSINNVQCSSSGNCQGQNLYTSGNFLNLTLCFLLLNVLI
ncbi:hypothetical protein ABPG74_002762 [Tetrahymena malaccensis]